MAKKVRTKNPNTPRPRNGGTMTEAEFMAMIHRALRKLTYRWIPIREAKKAAERPNQSSNKRLKYEYQCTDCDSWFPGKEVDVDHIEACGSMKLEDIVEYILKLFAEDPDSYQVLCKQCHKAKSKYEAETKKDSTPNPFLI